MPRRRTHGPRGIVYHALNRGNGRNELFHKPEDYSAFERIMTEAMDRCPIRLWSFGVRLLRLDFLCVQPDYRVRLYA